MSSMAGFVISILICSCSKDEADVPAPAITVFHPTSGAAGKAVTISGLNFGAGEANTVVTFNGTPAEITSHTQTVIQVIVPDGATTGPIAVTVGDITTISAAPFTVFPPIKDDPDFYFGSDLSYVNQILDHGGQYKYNHVVKDPYRIFGEHGNDLVRLRLWHNPVWTKDVYTPPGTKPYNDASDVAHAIRQSRQRGMKALLDFHYSDVWADPGAQEIPAAWTDIREIDVLRDSVYNYTYNTLRALGDEGLMPEFIQLGNEINCGMLYEYGGSAVPGFPSCNACNGQWNNLITIINAGIQAARDVSEAYVIKPRIILHVADPVNIDWWFDNVTSGGVNDFDIIGFSYYPIWHTGVSIDQLSDRIAGFRGKYDKDVMILETAYPWTSDGNDGYNNLFGSQPPVPGFPYTQQGQYEMMRTITQELIDGGGIGIIYWEPAWITSGIRDLWNTGSAWENCAFFDFNGNAIRAMDYMTAEYDR